MAHKTERLPEEYAKQAEELSDKSYLVVVSEENADGKTYKLAENPELPGCMAHGADYLDAIKNLRDARVTYIQSLLADGLPVPAPAPEVSMGAVRAQTETITFTSPDTDIAGVIAEVAKPEGRHELFSYRNLTPAEA
jgi:predicted RNase H-like HicB family nuclease